MTFDKYRLASGAVLVVATSLLVFAAACGGSGGSSASSSSVGGTGGSGTGGGGTGGGGTGGGGTGGGSGPSSGLSTTCGGASNCVALTSDNGIPGGYLNGTFTTVTVCVPGTTSCAQVGGILVDTGSIGLRLLKSKVSSISLVQSKLASGDSLLECYTFLDGFIWGPVATADIQIGGETAKSAPIMLIDDTPTPAFTAPGSCVGSGSTAPKPENSQDTLLANGILGIGTVPQDCGSFCEGTVASQTDTSGFAGFYYDCASTLTCTGTPLSLTAQVLNPVSKFTTDNNGTAISLPSIPSAGAANSTVPLTGALYFGIGTQSNNTMPSTAAVLMLDNFLNLTTTYKGTTNSSFIDSGSNGYFFVDSTIPVCVAGSVAGIDWFCPASTLTLSATNSGATGSSANSTVSFSVANTNTLFTTRNSAFSDLAGPGASVTFDLGLPFFYGRVVYNGIHLGSVTNTAGTTFAGPFVAY